MNSVKGITIGNKHTYRDWDCFMGKETSISFPDIKQTTIDVPGSDNVIDLTETLTGNVNYKTRKIKIVLYTIKKTKNWEEYISRISNYLHGKRLKIIFDEDPSFYYEGRCELNPLDVDANVGKIIIDVEADAYKYCINSTVEDWIWDSFNFEKGIIQELYDLQVNGNLELDLYNLKMKVSPIIIASNDMEIEFNSETYKIYKGENEMLDIEFVEGLNKIKIIGNGIISIEYRGGSL